MKLQLIETVHPGSWRERNCLYIFWEEARTYRMMVVYHGSGCADQSSPVGSSAILYPRWEAWVLEELGLIVLGKTSLIIPQRRGIIRAIRTAWFSEAGPTATNKPGQDERHNGVRGNVKGSGGGVFTK